ncbi:NADPH dehydrogenase NamA [Clostridium sp. D2Q-11]|uniref:NADPH dehydrogenase NamA n=1 Tax=Anaeromonas frigoriresistens TaxID=2683708 RepID=A0A942V201_9FIRM|nr:NADPH dehydrogenase NamA [Anaeromonas frigoriresistens]MBS4538532.1 NADPH dehydrogenase NamA [Anaeromonas frigoriresistens]
MSNLFSSIKIKDLNLKNRIVMAPMCMYSANKDGYANDWHYTHYTSRAIGGVGLILIEATAVESRGRISDGDLGIWDDSHVEGLKNIVDLSHKYDAKIGIQLAHAGRKCAVDSEEIIAPSSIAYNDKYGTPNEMTKDDIKEVINAFKKGASRAKEAGFDIIEIHGAHGYLISEFLSPLSNKRTDEYGGNFENRGRFLKEIIEEVRTVWPEDKPLMVRVSAEDYLEEGNHSKDLGNILGRVKNSGIDIVNVSSGGVAPAEINPYPGYQIKYAEIIKNITSLPVIAGGLITSPQMAEEIIQNERADLVYLGRALLRNPYWPLHSSQELGYDIQWPEQYDISK